MIDFKNIDWKNLSLDSFDFLNRNLILVITTVLFILINSLLYSYIYTDKYDKIISLEEEQKLANEKFITAQILSEKLNNVYNLFEINLASKKNDPKNKEANMLFLKELTDILEKLEIKLLQIEPGGKKKKGLLTYIPYSMEIKCNYEELGKFITELEGNNRLITVDEIIIKNGIEKIKTNIRDISEINDLITFVSVSTVTLNKALN